MFTHGHFARLLVVRWIQLPPKFGARFQLDAGAVSVLDFDAAALGQTRVVHWNRIWSVFNDREATRHD